MTNICLFTLLLALGLSHQCGAQLVVSDEKINAGIKVGYNYSRLGPTTTTARHSVFGAGYMNFPVAERWRAQGEFMISLQGAEYRYANRTNFMRTTVLGLPFTFQYVPYVKRTLFLEMGVQPIINLTTRINGSRAYRLRDEIWVSDVELLAGVGGMINKTIGFNFRYNHGLKNLGRSLNVALEPIRNRVFQVGLIINVESF